MSAVVKDIFIEIRCNREEGEGRGERRREGGKKQKIGTYHHYTTKWYVVRGRHINIKCHCKQYEKIQRENDRVGKEPIGANESRGSKKGEVIHTGITLNSGMGSGGISNVFTHIVAKLARCFLGDVTLPLLFRLLLLLLLLLLEEGRYL